MADARHQEEAVPGLQFRVILRGRAAAVPSRHSVVIVHILAQGDRLIGTTVQLDDLGALFLG
jgi:hypothetical protein